MWCRITLPEVTVSVNPLLLKCQVAREQLKALRKRINPRQLRREIYDLIDHIFSLPNAVPGKTENVHETLITNSDPENSLLNLTVHNSHVVPTF